MKGTIFTIYAVVLLDSKTTIYIGCTERLEGRCKDLRKNPLFGRFLSDSKVIPLACSMDKRDAHYVETRLIEQRKRIGECHFNIMPSMSRSGKEWEPALWPIAATGTWRNRQKQLRALKQSQIKAVRGLIPRFNKALLGTRQAAKEKETAK